MASTYSTNLAIELIGTGDQAGSWGNTTNTNLGTLIEQAISGYVTQAVSTGTDTTITIPNGATGVARNMYIELTGTGGTNTNLIVPANKKLYFIFNNSTGAVTVKVSGQTGVSVPQGKKVVLTSNGTDIVNGLNYIADFGSNSATITQLTATSATITNLTLTSLVISNLSIASANITTLTATNETISGNLTLSGGTANGVLYLNGSKVATSGSGLYTDGSRLGIGTVSFPAGQRLRVAGGDVGFEGQYFYLLNADANIQMGAAQNAQIINSDTGNLLTFSRTGASSAMAFSTAGSEAMRITNAQNVGIGTASPRGNLDVSSGNLAGSQTRSIHLGYSAADFYGFRVANINDAGATYAGTFRIQRGVGSSWSDDVVVNDSGNVGIGTTSPSDILTLAGGASGSYGLTINNAKVGGGTKAIFQYDATNQIALVGGNTTNGLAFQTLTSGSLTTKATLDSSGNLGLGVTPSGWGVGYKAFQTAYLNFASGTAGQGDGSITWNAYNNGTNWIYQYTGGVSTRYRQNESGHAWFTAPSGTAGNTISFTQAMTLDASGNLGIGTTSPAQKLHVVGNAYRQNDASNSYGFTISTTSGTTTLATLFGGSSFGIQINGSGVNNLFLNSSGNLSLAEGNAPTQVLSLYRAGSTNAIMSAGNSNTGLDGTWFGVDTAGNGIVNVRGAFPLLFSTSANERARITAAGEFLVGTTTANSATGITLRADGVIVAKGVYNTLVSSNTRDIYMDDSGYFGYISSTRASKTNIVNATDVSWLLALNPVSFNYKKFDRELNAHIDEPIDEVQYGLIAEDVEAVKPELCFYDEVNGKQELRGVSYSKLVTPMLKLIQQQQAAIAALEAKVAALEAK